MPRNFRRIPAVYRRASEGSHGDTLEDDSSLVERAQKGDAQAFAHLDRRYRDKLKAFLGKKYGLDPYETDDIAQAAFIKAHRGLPKFLGRRGCSFWTWLLRYVGTSTAKDYFRTQGRNRKAKGQAIADSEERKRLGEDTLDNSGLTAKYEI